MKITLSPLVAALHGRAASTVAVVTRGVQYIKKHGRPHGPPSQAQLDQRAQMQRLGKWWRSLPVQIRTFLNLLGAETGNTGFAIFTKQCAHLHSPAYDPTIIPPNQHQQVIVDVWAMPGMYPGDIHLWWQDSPFYGNVFLHFFTAAKSGNDIKNLFPDAFTYHSANVSPVFDEHEILTGFYPGIPYWVVTIASKLELLAANTTFGGGDSTSSYPGPP